LNLSKRPRIGLVVGIVVAVTAAVGAALLSGHAGAATRQLTAAPKTSNASAVLRATTGSGRGTFTGKVSSVSAASGTLAWKLTYSGLSGPATGVQLRLGSKVLVHLCSSSCPSGVHKSTVLHGATFRAAKDGKLTLTVATKASPTGEIKGALKIKGTSVTAGGGGGGSTTVPVTPATIAAGKALASQFGCTGCHTITGAKSTGPTWKGLAGSTVHLTSGKTVIATDAYLIGVITDPATLNVAGYDSGVMSEVIAPGEVSHAQAAKIVAYIKSLK
jgi:mono/diheme cytochrome c family protein